jgi:hypothetical protein
MRHISLEEAEGLVQSLNHLTRVDTGFGVGDGDRERVEGVVGEGHGDEGSRVEGRETRGEGRWRSDCFRRMGPSQ